MLAQLDHLVVMASTLDEGARWCEHALGIPPGPGGRHARFGTHNRLFKIASPGFPKAYFEIIALDPDAPALECARWFDMDDPDLRARVCARGPQLIHWVARVDDMQKTLADLGAVAKLFGPVLSASRPVPDGLLQWQITVRTDGRRPMGGALPTLIQWQGPHPADRMPESCVTLVKLGLRHPRALELRRVLQRLGLEVDVQEGVAPGLHVTLSTPLGTVTLD